MDDCFLRGNSVVCHRFGREGKKKTRAIRIKQSGWEEEEGARKGRNIHRATTFWRREKITPKRERERESSFHLFQSLVDNIFFERVCEEKRVKKPRVRSEEHRKALTHLLLLPFRAYNSRAKLNGKAKAKTDCCRVPFAERRRGGGNHPEIFS